MQGTQTVLQGVQNGKKNEIGLKKTELGRFVL
jgi:hypothetical protein